MSLPTSIPLLVSAALCEIGGEYLVWLWFREGRPLACEYCVYLMLRPRLASVPLAWS